MSKFFPVYLFYKITCKDDEIDVCYVGSTSNWKQRNISHKSSCYNPNVKDYNSKKYQTIRENGGWDNFKMVEIGFRENLTLREAHKIEEEYRVEHRAKLNGVKCYVSVEDSKKRDLENKKKYYKENSEEILQHKQEYYKENQQKLKEKKSKKVECECGDVISYNHMARHRRSKKHLSSCVPVEPS